VASWPHPNSLTQRLVSLSAQHEQGDKVLGTLLSVAASRQQALLALMKAIQERY
jgi:hypothetical protein